MWEEKSFHHQTAIERKDWAKSLLIKPFLQACPTLCAGILYAGALLLPVISHAEDNKQVLQNIQQDIAEKEKTVQLQVEKRNQLQTQLRVQDKSIAKSSQILRDTASVLDSLDSDVLGLTYSIQQLQEKQKSQQEYLSKQLDAAFRQGQHSAFQLIFSGEESKRSERILAYFNYLNDARLKSITALEKTQTELAKQKKTLQQKQSQQAALLDQQKTEKEKLESARTARQGTLKSLEITLQKDQQKLAELKQNETRLRDQIVKAEKEARARAQREAQAAAKVRVKEQQAKKAGSSYKPTADERSLMARTGGLGQPASQNIWPARGRVTHRFGEQQQGELRWKGVTIAAAEGSEVRAIAAGRVLLADWLQGYGLVVVVEHGKGDMSLYGYNQSALVSVGAQVRAGQPIALVGTSGGQGEPSLYFEIRRQGQAVNPLPWLGR